MNRLEQQIRIEGIKTSNNTYEIINDDGHTRMILDFDFNSYIVTMTELTSCCGEVISVEKQSFDEYKRFAGL